MNLPEGQYAIYLRKSRKDIEDEARTGEDTLKSHRRALFDLAKRYNLSIGEVYSEVVTGERISVRPEMQRLLADVDENKWQGVLVVEVERLARGDTSDQGEVAQAFKFSQTLIITPTKTYDPNNQNDEEYFEFGLFMSRREYKTITRRLQWGRNNAVEEGRYPGNVAPYGYNRKKLHGKGWTLELHPNESQIIRMIFEIYTHPDIKERKGTQGIADYLNQMKIPSRKKTGWSVPTIRDIIRNPVYCGYVRWGRRKAIKKRDGSITRPRQKDWTETKGLHPPIISRETWELAQEIMDDNSRPPMKIADISNPLAGLIRCEICGGPMIYRPYGKNTQPPQLYCKNKECPCVGSAFHVVEKKLINNLKLWLKRYKEEWKHGKPKHDNILLDGKEQIVATIERELDGLQSQKNKLHDLVESGAYTVDEYLERSQVLAQKIHEASEALEQAREEYEKEKQRTAARVDVIPKVEHVIKLYPKSNDPAKKNELLRSILETVYYRRDHGGRWSKERDNFTITLLPKLPK